MVKSFFFKAGWITVDWLPYFILLRRDNKSFDEMYHNGLMNPMEKKIHDCIIRNHEMALHELDNQFLSKRIFAICVRYLLVFLHFHLHFYINITCLQ